jgi:hypothetical protein
MEDPSILDLGRRYTGHGIGRGRADGTPRPQTAV